MSCSVRAAVMPKGEGVTVNGVAISRDVIARETQHHPARSPAMAWVEAARSLVIRELLLQEARRLGICGTPRQDREGRRETDDDAAIRDLVEREVTLPAADPATCRRYYEQNRHRFRSSDIFEAAHILIPAVRSDPKAYALAQEEATAIIATLHERPDTFGDLARQHSACASAAQDGNLGQISSGQTTPEFEAALKSLAAGSVTGEPVATRYGFHVIRLDRRIEGCEVPFDMVAEQIAEYLRESVQRRATAQYIARLVSHAVVTGVDLPGAAEHQVY